MEKTSQLLLEFLLNASWQTALITAVAALCAWLLREAPARARHLLWVAVLTLCFGMPALTCFYLSSGVVVKGQPPQLITAQPESAGAAQIPLDTSPSLKETVSFIPINGNLAAVLGALYLVFLCYRSIKLFWAWKQTRAIARSASPTDPLDHARTIIERCKTSLGVTRVDILCSPAVPVPITIGSLNPLVILPEPLLREAEADVLTAAIGHELVHVLRHDYALNLIYELIYLPLSFHPAVALVRRQITQTRELRCDEMVAARLLNAEAYARSLVQLAGSALPVGNRAKTITVGIADADILEVRIMSLLRRTRSSVRKNKLLLLAACVLLAVPCVAAASFAFHFSINPPDTRLIAPVPSVDVQEKDLREAQKREAREREEREMKERAERDPQFKAELEKRERREQEEREIRSKQQAELARLAKVTMDQAIQTATSQQPGKVLECSLIGKHWEAPGKLAKDGQVFYHVVILFGDEANPNTTHVWVDAIDGSIRKTEKEER